MNPDIALTVLETAGIVRPVASHPEPEYAFRHGLLHESAYGLLLKAERDRLHYQVGRALEASYPQRKAELSPLLASHFLQGGDLESALHYLRMAADQAHQRYANTEALVHFGDALKVSRELGRPLVQASLHRDRGFIHEIVGNFESAQEDYERALALGQELREPTIEWRALLDLGKLWAARNYEKTGEYFQKALELARTIGNQEVIARSLNRLGNWHINIGEPTLAKERHLEALEIFEQEQDQEGIAETLDFLGMASMMSSDVKQGAQYYDRAIDLLRELGDTQRLANALTSYALRIGSTQTETVLGVDAKPDRALEDFGEAVELARELGWKSGECFTQWTRAFLLNSLGRLGEALEAGTHALTIAQEMNHIQWMAASHSVLSRTRLEMMDHKAGLGHAALAWELAQQMASIHWLGISVGLTGFAHLAAGEPKRAEETLREYLEPEPGWKMLGDRLFWLARVELLLAQGEHQEALQLVNQLIETAPNYTEGRVIPRLFRVRGLALVGLNRIEAAREQFQAAIRRTKRQGIRILTWRLHGDLARLERELEGLEAAEGHLTAGRKVLTEIGETINNPEDRRQFLERATVKLEDQR